MHRSPRGITLRSSGIVNFNLSLVERVFLRIGSAETDEQLQTALGKFLAPLLLKLNSPDETIRSKVLKLLAHIKTRLKSRSQIRLPLDALLTQFQDPQATPFITNFTILYIKLGFPRVEPEKQAELVPLLINCLDGRSTNHQDSILQLLTPALQHVKMPKTETECRAKFQLLEKPAVKELLLDFFMDILLLPYNAHVSAISSPAVDGTDGTSASNPPPVAVAPPPGLSTTALKRVTGDNPLLPEELEKAKLSIINFLGSGVVPEEEIVCHFVVAASDTRHSVATSADMELKKITGSVDWNSKYILNKLCQIFQGTVVVKGQGTIKPEDRRSPVLPRIRLKIFPIFLKAREASNMFPAALQIVFDCLFGSNPNAKLKSMAVQFVHHMCLNCDDAKFAMIDAVLLNGMLKVIKETQEVNCDDAKFAMIDVVLLNGMLKVIKETQEDPKLRSLAYVAVGKIARRSPHRLSKDIQIVQTFFDAICQEEGDTRLAVQEALSMMSDAFCNIDSTHMALMEALLLQSIDKDEYHARVVAVQYAARVFPSDHIPSRYILMLASGDIKDDVRGEAVKALRGTQSIDSTKQRDKYILPDFVDTINYVREKANQRKVSNHRYVSGNTTLPFNPMSYTETLLYLRMCLAQSAGVPADWQLENLPEHAPVVSVRVRTLLSEYPDQQGPVQEYVRMLQELLAVSASGEVMYCLLEIVAMVPDVLTHQFVQHLDWLKGLLGSSKDDLKQYAAELYAIISFHTNSNGSGFDDQVESLLTALQNKNPELGLGAILCLGYFIGLKVKSLQSDSIAREQMYSNAVLVKTVRTISKLLKEHNVSVKIAACSALAEIGRCGPLPLPAGEDETEKSPAGSFQQQDGKEKEPEEGTSPNEKKQKKDEKTEDGGKTEENNITKLSVVDTLIAMIKTSNEANKTKEKAAACLGGIGVGEEDFPHRRKAMSDLFNAIQSKQVELQFTIGQALVDMAMGPSSPRARCVWTTGKVDHQKNVTGIKDDVAWFLNELLSKYICHANPHLRQSACVWLLTLVRETGHHAAVQVSLLDIQRGFMRMLSENDEITQDMASKGLGQIMEICTPEQKDKLVSELVETLMTGKSTKNEVSADTTIFQSGTLGKAPDGGGLSTYKELCAIATDLNQPDLIYKFMHLANHNATWNARKGAAFGFSTIAAQAGEQLAPYMQQIVPRLYRYQFDPNPKIQQAMSGIWNALVQDNKKTIDTYLKEILADLLKNLTSNQWRIRESSCLAVSDLLRGRVLDNIVEDIPQLWETCLRVRDDIKESVRLAADSACKTLSKVSVKICDVTNGKVGEKATSLVLPCLLQCSLNSTVQEVRTIGLSTILQISRQAGALLKPNIPVLVTALLEAVSGLEPNVINYLSLHMGTQANQDRLDNARIAQSKMSPMMETVNRCVQYVDDTVLPELVPRLVELIRGGIGVSTKAGCSSFVVSLTHQCPQDLAPYAGKLLGAFLHGLGDRNATVRKSYATAIGHLVKVAKDSSVEKLIQKLKTWYLESEDSNAHHACSVTLQAMARHAPDILRRHAKDAMPLAFFAMHEERKKEDGEGGGGSRRLEETSDWEDVWNEITPGTEAGIRLYLPEIVDLASSCLQSQLWSVKAQSARAIATVADKLGSQLGPPHLASLLTAVLDGLSGRTWQGKEALLRALSTICTSCKDEILRGTPESKQPSIEQILTVLLRECGKEQPVYKMAAMKALGPVLELYELDHFRAVWDMTQAIVTQVVNPKNGNVDEDDDSSLGQKQELITCCFTLLGEAWPGNTATQENMVSTVVSLLCEALPLSTWKVQLILLKDMQILLDRSALFHKEGMIANSEKAQELCNKIFIAAFSQLGNIKFVSLRSESLAVLERLIKRLTEADLLSLLEESGLGCLQEELGNMAESGPWELRDRAKDALKLTHGSERDINSATPSNAGDLQQTHTAMEH
ncbi:proteasome-associated protein ecm29-like protein [Plakobranchus ocellatus]|uniref:Proteasome-associated protein ecm29-like protein n=1 Tax=Plakobranchus ocellatus TaxID=259542 RepID=A0AAV3ZWB1_9GAST|nr:proteasome-associated protein ecm29-like protein [Plakobranchus ocellatus]